MNIKRITSLLLVMLLVLSVAVSCKDTPDETKETKKPNSDVEASSTTAMVKEKYKDYNYEGYKFRILSISPGEHYYRLIDEKTANEVWYEDESADSYQTAVYKRNLLAEELLDIVIDEPHWGGTGAETPSQAKRMVAMNNDDFDMMVCTLDKAMSLGMEGVMYNLHAIETFDITADWWDQQLVQTYSYENNKLYAIAGDYNVFDDYAMPVVFYNKNVMTAYSLNDPADLVESGTWTIDAMMTMAEAATHETSGDGIMGDGDAWGLTDNGDSELHFLEGTDALIAVPDGDGVPVVNCTSESFINASEYIYNRLINSNALYQGDNEYCVEMMLQDRSLFYYELLGAINEFRNMEAVFSLLPLPKLNDSQKDYASVVNTVWCTALSVPITASANFDKIGIIMNVLGGFSTDTVDKTLYEVILGARLIREPSTTKMLGYVLDSKAYDWGKEFGWANSIYNVLKGIRPGTAFTLSSSLQSNIRVMQRSLKIFIKDAK